MRPPQQIRQPLKTWAGMLGFGWFILVIGVYFVSHKPFTAEIALNLAGIIGQILVAFIFWFVSGGLGARLLKDLPFPPLVSWALQSAMGLGLLGAAWLMIGVTLGFGWLQGTIVTLVLFILLFKDSLNWTRRLSELRKLWNRSGRFGKFMGFELVIVLLATFTLAVAPPVRFDALVYHLRLPHLYLQHGRFVYIPEIMFWGMPQLGEMLFTSAISIGGDSAAALLSWLAGSTALIGLFGWLEDRLGLPAAWGGLAALLAGFTLASSLSWAYVDWLAILFGTAFLIGMQAWHQSRDRRLLLLAGAFAGLALSTKYTAGILLLSGMVFVVWDAYRQRHLAGVARSLFLFCAAGLLVFSPWLFKNFIATGSPIYPFLFPAGAMDTVRQEIYQGGPAWGNWLDVIFLPWRATSVGAEAAPGYSASIGPLLLGLGALAGLGLKSFRSEGREFIRDSAALFVPVLVLWMILGRFSSYLLQTRLYLAIFPAVAALGGAGFQAIARMRLAGVRFGRITAAMILFVMGLVVFEVGSNALSQGSLVYLAGLIDAQSYRQQNLGAYEAAIDAINDLPAGSKVLFLWEPRSLGCKLDCDPDEILDRWLHDLAIYKTANVVQAEWIKQGYTHLLYYQLGADFLQREDARYQQMDWAALENIKPGWVELADLDGVYDLYALP